MGRDSETGKKKYQWIAAGSNKKQAERKLNETVNQLNHGSFVKPGRITVREHLLQWHDGYVDPNLAQQPQKHTAF